MSRYDWLLFLHILSAFALVAALVLYTILIVAGRRLDVPSDVVRVFRISRVGDVLVAVGSLGVLAFGIWLAIEVDEYELWDGWIIAAFVLWLAMGAVGSRVGKIYDGVREQARALAGQGGDAPSPELAVALRSQTGLVLHLVMIAIVILLLLDMVYKPGA
jgi:uncharacterized membrane protein